MTATPANENNKQYNNNNNNTNNNNDNNNNAILCFIPFKSALASRHLIMTKIYYAALRLFDSLPSLCLFLWTKTKQQHKKLETKKKGKKIIQIISCNFTSILTTYSRVSIIYVAYLAPSSLSASASASSSASLSGLIIEACPNCAQVFPQTRKRCE